MRIKKVPLKKTERNRVFFSLEIDFVYYNGRWEDMKSLQPGGCYFLKKKNNNDVEETTYEEIVDYIENIINNELKFQWQKCCNVPIEELKVIATYHGSIHVIFTTIFSALGVVSEFKDLYDCIELFKQISRAHIMNKLEEQYGVPFRVNIDSIADNVEDDNRYHQMDAVPFTQSRRDAFFYYLLISNMILLILIGLLVSKAVLKMYW